MKKILFCYALLLIASCSNNRIEIKNDKKGKLQAKMALDEIGSKSFILDDETAPKPLYIQIINDTLGERQLTFLNNYNNSIYFYDFENQEFLKKITLDKDGPDGVPMPEGYHIKNQDSIYLFSRLLKIFLINSNGNVINKASLNSGHDVRGKDIGWAYRYPEFYLETVTPFMERPKEFLLTGIFGGTMPDSIVDKFKFTAHIDFDLKSVEYSHTYPRSLFGNNVNWGEGLSVQVFPQMYPNNNKMIYSFPMSHHLFITDMEDNNYSKVYAGSNFASSIKSIDKRPGRASAELIRSSFVRQDMYAAIIYDKYRKIFYRFLRRGIPDAPKETSWKEKEIAVIIMDEKFNYLGETTLGTERVWHWQNSFVTEEGLNIEYLEENDISEVNITFKTLIPKRK